MEHADAAISSGRRTSNTVTNTAGCPRRREIVFSIGLASRPELAATQRTAGSPSRKHSAGWRASAARAPFTRSMTRPPGREVTTEVSRARDERQGRGGCPSRQRSGVDGKRNTVRPWVPANRQIRFLRPRLVTRLHKGIRFLPPLASVPPSPLSLFRPEPRGPVPPFDDALTERGCRRGILPGRTAFSSCYSSRGSRLYRTGAENGGRKNTAWGSLGGRACRGRWSGCSTKCRTSRHQWRSHTIE